MNLQFASRRTLVVNSNYLSTDSSYENETAIVGEVYQVDVRKSVCRLFDAGNKRNVLVHFDQSLEDKITTGLKNHMSQLLEFEGIGVFNDRGKMLRLRDVSKLDVFRDGIETSDKSNTTHESI